MHSLLSAAVLIPSSSSLPEKLNDLISNLQEIEVYNHEVYKPDNTAYIKYYLIINWKHTCVVKYSQNDGHK